VASSPPTTPSSRRRCRRTPSGEEEQFYKPTDEQVVKSQCYDKITETGSPSWARWWARTTSSSQNAQPWEEGRDSYALRTNEHGTVDIIAAGPGHSTVNGDGYPSARSAYGAPGAADRRQAVQPLGTEGTIGMLVPRHAPTDGVVPTSSNALPQSYDDKQLLRMWARRAAWTVGGATPPFNGRATRTCQQLADLRT
jgi:hypothetical protein